MATQPLTLDMITRATLQLYADRLVETALTPTHLENMLMEWCSEREAERWLSGGLDIGMSTHWTQ